MVVKFTHVRAHQGMDAGRQAVGNEYADRYANKGAEEGSDTIITDNSFFTEGRMDETLINLTNGYIHDANVIVKEINTNTRTQTRSPP